MLMRAVATRHIINLSVYFPDSVNFQEASSHLAAFGISSMRAKGGWNVVREMAVFREGGEGEEGEVVAAVVVVLCI